MDPKQFFTSSRLLIVAGKGGVGKTTVAAAMGVAATRLGIDTLLVEIEGKRGLATLFDEDDLGYDDVVIVEADESTGGAALRARTIRPDAALLDYFADHGLSRFGKTLTRLQVLDTLATSTPGLRDLIVLGKIKQLESGGDAELIIVDAPASGHAISFLRAARTLQASIDTGPIRRQADEVAAMLTDPARAQVLLVTLAEETPVNELIETAYALEEDVGILLGPCIVNAVHEDSPTDLDAERRGEVDAELDAAATAAAQWWSRRVAGEQEQLDRLLTELPLERIVLPRRFTTRLGRADVEALADEVLASIARLRFGAPE